ncbi:MAG: MarR family winged helix-turn-helix transcriptional regulator [Lachnospiraceae bacterium]|nr:MarR family winged helix-turn-helix transcriptional regulator [Lachnospiraceae bacterium]MDD7077297.1 MarR family winged helix-turn-helix transcriptional regulator [Lachnospiraceae bacterium]MDY3729392.1 MarR family winged helix-turn-helix transcriptional regulator [Candidatus Choladocola sp.]
MTGTQKNIEIDKNEIGKLSAEMTYRHYLMNKGKFNQIFKKLTIPEYIALHIVASQSTASDHGSPKVYLRKLAEKMELEIYQASKVAGDLKDRGLVLWSHDGNGNEGTYVILTETGERWLQEQEEILKEYYGTIIKTFGKENFIELLQQMKKFDDVMNSVLEEKEQ